MFSGKHILYREQIFFAEFIVKIKKIQQLSAKRNLVFSAKYGKKSGNIFARLMVFIF